MEPSLLTTCIPLGNYSQFAPTTGTNASTSADTLAGGFESAAGYAAYSTALSVTIAIGCSLLILNVLIFAGLSDKSFLFRSSRELCLDLAVD